MYLKKEVYAMEKNLRNKRNNDLFAQYVRACNSCTSEEEQQKRYKEVCTCNHVFALYQPTKYYGALHSSDCYAKDAIIECVHCGLTNKFISFEEELTLMGNLRRGILVAGAFSLKADPYENQLFKKISEEGQLKDAKIIGIEELDPVQVDLQAEAEYTNKNALYQSLTIDYKASKEETLKRIRLAIMNEKNMKLGQEEYAIKSDHLGLLYKMAIKIAASTNPEASSEEILTIMRSLFNMETTLEKIKLETMEDAEDLMSRYQNSMTLTRRKEV